MPKGARYLVFLMLVLGGICHGTKDAAACALLPAPLVVATPIIFGIYNPTQESDADSLITISCTVVTSSLPAFTISLSAGAANDFSPRTMTAGTPTLNYNLYTTPGNEAPVWGDGSDGSVTQSYTGDAGLTILTAYGIIPKGQYVLSGLYIDTITVTVTY